MRAKLMIVCVTCLAGGAVWAQSSPQDLLKALTSEDAAVRQAAFEIAAIYGPEAIVVIAPLLDNPSFEVERAAKMALEKIVGAASATEETRVQAARALAIAAISVKNRDWLLWLLSYTGGVESQEALLALLDTAPEQFQRILMALESIGQQRDDTGAVAVLEAPELPKKLLAKFPQWSEGQQLAAINTLGALRAAAAVPDLLKLAKQPGAVGSAALEALGRIGTPEAADVLLDRFTEARTPEFLNAALRVAEHMESKSAFKFYRALQKVDLGGAPESLIAAVECAALLGKARVASSTRVIKYILPALESERADVTGAAKQALLMLSMPGATETIAKAVRRAEPPVKAAVLEVLAERDWAVARPYLEEAIEDEDEGVRVAALQILGDKPEPAFAETFIKAAQEGPEAERPVALRGYLNLAARALADDHAKALDMYHAALPLAERDEERLQALEGLTALADAASLPHLTALHQNPRLDFAATTAALTIAAASEASDQGMARGVYRDVLKSTKDRKLAQQAEQGLRRLGVAEDFARDAGFLTDWVIIGSFAAKAFSDKFPPETEAFDAAASYPGAEGQQVTWKAWHTSDIFGITDFDQIYTPKENVIAYARTVITVAQLMDAVLKIGSDDGVVAWLNGQEIHKNNAQRRVHIDEDIVPISLQPGENVLLLKIVQGGSDWGFTVRLVDTSEKPVSLSAVAR